MEQLKGPRSHITQDMIGKYLYDETLAALMGEVPLAEVTVEEEEDLWNS
jgi:hypothetical protein